MDSNQKQKSWLQEMSRPKRNPKIQQLDEDNIICDRKMDAPPARKDTFVVMREFHSGK